MMKRVLFTLILSAALCSASYAQRFKVGIRAGVNFSDYSISTLSTDDGLLQAGKTRTGFEAALVTRLALTKHLNLQAEFEYDRVNYQYRLLRTSNRRDINVNTNRMEIPLTLGINLGPVRVFGGAAFRVSHNEKSQVPSLLTVKFDDSKVALTGGAALNIRKFFVEGRITGYPRTTHNIITVNSDSHRVRVSQDLKWSLSAGFLF